MTAPLTRSGDRLAQDGLAPRPSFRSVLHVNEKGGRFGGTEEYIALLTGALASRDVRSHLVCGVVGADEPPGFESTHVVRGLASRQPRAGTPDAVVDVVAAVDPDVVYVHNVFDPAVVEAVAAHAGERAVIWYVHDHYLTCLTELRWRHDLGACPHRLGSDCLTAIEAGLCVRRHPGSTFGAAALDARTSLFRSLGAVDAVVVVSEYMRRSLVDAEPALVDRLHRVTRPVRAPVGRRGRVRRPADPTVIVCAGRITAEKGQAVVIEALGALPASGPVELRIAGVIEDAAYWDHCRQLRDLATDRNPRLTVEYLGHLDYDATDAQLGVADIVTVPSQWPEPLGAVALEAMAAGATVVASDIGGLADTITAGHDGLLVHPSDVPAWTAAIASLVGAPDDARRLADQAIRNLAAATIESHVEALDHIVSRHRTGSRETPTAIDLRRRRRMTDVDGGW